MFTHQPKHEEIKQEHHANKESLEVSQLEEKIVEVPMTKPQEKEIFVGESHHVHEPAHKVEEKEHVQKKEEIHHVYHVEHVHKNKKRSGACTQS